MVELIVGPSVRPSCGVGGGSSSLGGNGERGAGNGHCLQAPRAATSALLTDRPTRRPSCLSHSSASPSHEKENTRSWKVGRTVDDGVKDGRNGGKGREREGRRNE